MNLGRWLFSFTVLSVVAVVLGYYASEKPTELATQHGHESRRTLADYRTLPFDRRTHHGIDVSAHSGAVHWDSIVAQGFKFAFVKATEGVDLEDSAFDRHWRQLRTAGIARGAYHFYVTEDSPVEQAQFFIRTVALVPGDLAPVVDIEKLGRNTPPGIADSLAKFLTIIEEHYRVRPIIYTSHAFWNSHLSGDFGRYPLWIAEYDVDEPKIPNGWFNWQLWQWQGDAHVAGVEKTADVTRINMPRFDLTDFLVPEYRGAI